MCAVDARASATCYLVICPLGGNVVLVTLDPGQCILCSMGMTTLYHLWNGLYLTSLQLLFPSIITLEFTMLLCLTVSCLGC